MRESDWDDVIASAMGPATGYLASLQERPVYRPTDPDDIRALVGGPLPEEGSDPAEVVGALARDLEPYVTAHASGRYYGFVIGGLHPAAYGAELLAATWDQNAGLYAVAQGVAIAEEVAAEWVLDVLDLPADSSVGFVTGGQMANFTCLAAARHHVLREAGWNVEADGLQGSPKVNVVVKTEKHSTIPRALRHLGFGDSTAIEVASDQQSRIDPEALDLTLRDLEGPTIVCAEAGNVNFGSFDDLEEVADVAERHRERGNPTWVHVDGAFGLWARAATMVNVFLPISDDMSWLDWVQFLAVGSAVGSIFATIVFCASVVSLPMMLDRNTDAITSALTSVNAAIKASRNIGNPSTATVFVTPATASCSGSD